MLLGIDCHLPMVSIYRHGTGIAVLVGVLGRLIVWRNVSRTHAVIEPLDQVLAFSFTTINAKTVIVCVESSQVHVIDPSSNSLSRIRLDEISNPMSAVVDYWFGHILIRIDEDRFLTASVNLEPSGYQISVQSSSSDISEYLFKLFGDDKNYYVWVNQGRRFFLHDNEGFSVFTHPKKQEYIVGSYNYFKIYEYGSELEFKIPEKNEFEDLENWKGVLEGKRFRDFKSRISPCGTFFVLDGGYNMAMYETSSMRDNLGSIRLARRDSDGSVSVELLDTVKVSNNAKMAFDCYSRLYLLVGSGDAPMLSVLQYDKSWQRAFQSVVPDYYKPESKGRNEPHGMAIEAASRNEVYLIVFYERASIYRLDISRETITLFKRLDVEFLGITYISSHIVWIDKECQLWSWAFREDDDA